MTDFRVFGEVPDVAPGATYSTRLDLRAARFTSHFKRAFPELKTKGPTQSSYLVVIKDGAMRQYCSGTTVRLGSIADVH